MFVQPRFVLLSIKPTLSYSDKSIIPVNGTYSCENDKILNGILKTEYGFPGYVMSDWWATHSTESANRGLDVSTPVLVV